MKTMIIILSAFFCANVFAVMPPQLGEDVLERNIDVETARRIATGYALTNFEITDDDVEPSIYEAFMLAQPTGEDAYYMFVLPMGNCTLRVIVNNNGTVHTESDQDQNNAWMPVTTDINKGGYCY